MYWNHRIVRRVDGDDVSFIIAEVFYNDDDSLIGWSDASVAGDTIDEMVANYDQMESALTKRILDEGEFGGVG